MKNSKEAQKIAKAIEYVQTENITKLNKLVKDTHMFNMKPWLESSVINLAIENQKIKSLDWLWNVGAVHIIEIDSHIKANRHKILRSLFLFSHFLSPKYEKLRNWADNLLQSDNILIANVLKYYFTGGNSDQRLEIYEWLLERASDDTKKSLVGKIVNKDVLKYAINQNQIKTFQLAWALIVEYGTGKYIRYAVKGFTSILANADSNIREERWNSLNKKQQKKFLASLKSNPEVLSTYITAENLNKLNWLWNKLGENEQNIILAVLKSRPEIYMDIILHAERNDLEWLWNIIGEVEQTTVLTFLKAQHHELAKRSQTFSGRIKLDSLKWFWEKFDENEKIAHLKSFAITHEAYSIPHIITLLICSSEKFRQTLIKHAELLQQLSASKELTKSITDRLTSLHKDAQYKPLTSFLLATCNTENYYKVISEENRLYKSVLKLFNHIGAIAIGFANYKLLSDITRNVDELNYACKVIHQVHQSPPSNFALETCSAYLTPVTLNTNTVFYDTIRKRTARLMARSYFDENIVRATAQQVLLSGGHMIPDLVKITISYLGGIIPGKSDSLESDLSSLTLPPLTNTTSSTLALTEYSLSRPKRNIARKDYTKFEVDSDEEDMSDEHEKPSSSSSSSSSSNDTSNKREKPKKSAGPTEYLLSRPKRNIARKDYAKLEMGSDDEDMSDEREKPASSYSSSSKDMSDDEDMRKAKEESLESLNKSRKRPRAEREREREVVHEKEEEHGAREFERAKDVLEHKSSGSPFGFLVPALNPSASSSSSSSLSNPHLNNKKAKAVGTVSLSSQSSSQSFSEQVKNSNKKDAARHKS